MDKNDLIAFFGQAYTGKQRVLRRPAHIQPGNDVEYFGQRFFENSLNDPLIHVLLMPVLEDDKIPQQP